MSIPGLDDAEITVEEMAQTNAIGLALGVFVTSIDAPLYCMIAAINILAARLIKQQATDRADALDSAALFHQELVRLINAYDEKGTLQ